jgi:hypothetical protein
MNPADILKISQQIKLDGNSNQMQQLEGLLKGMQ